MEWWERVNLLLDARKITPADLARSAGLQPTTVYKYLDGKIENPRGDTIKRIARILNVSELYLRHGEPSATVVELSHVPLLSVSTMGTLKRDQNFRAVWNGENVIGVPPALNTDSVFGATLDDESGLPDITPGEVVIFDRTAPITPGRIVVAIDEKTRKAHVGRYRPSSNPDNVEQFSIAPINTDYPEIEFSTDRPGHVYARAIMHLREI